MKITHYLSLFVIALAMNACNNAVQKSKVDKEESLEEIAQLDLRYLKTYLFL